MMTECELPIFYGYTEPVAKKQHQCCECSAPILVGEKHFHCTGKWHGDKKPQSYRQHDTCREACEVIRDSFGGECIGVGSLKEEFNELVCDDWYPQNDRWNEPWKKLRHLMAVILVRERRHKLLEGKQ